MSGVGSSCRVDPRAPLELGRRGLDGAVVADGRGHDQRVEPGAARLVVGQAVERRAQVGRRLDAQRGRLARRLDLHVRRDQRDAGAAGQRRLGDRHAHPPARAVADEADRVDRLARPARAHHDVAAGEVGLASRLDLRGPSGRVRPHGPVERRSPRPRRRRWPAARPGARRPTGPTRARPTPVRRSCSRTRRAAARRWRCVAGCDHMSPSIAGATTTGAPVARAVAVTTSPDSPAAIAPSQCAVAGATTRASAVSATTMCPIRPSGSSASTSVSTAWRDSASNDSGPMNAAAEGVSIATTSAPSARSSRSELDRLVGGDRPGDAQPDQPALESTGHGSPSSSRSPPATSAWRIASPLRVRSGSIASTPSRSAAHGAADSPPVRIARTLGRASRRSGRPARGGSDPGVRRRDPDSRTPCPTASR